METIHFNSNKPVFIKNDFIDINEIDIYTQTSFQELRNELFSYDLDYYLCVVKQNGQTYLFDAESFIRDYFRNQNVFINPINRQSIQKCSIYRSTKKTLDFEWVTNQVGIEENKEYIPILCNSLTLNKEKKGSLWLEYAESKKSTNLELARTAYTKAAKLENLEAQKELFYPYRDRKDYEQAAYWIEEIIKKHPDNMSNFAAAERIAIAAGKYHKYYAYNKVIAKHGNLIGVCSVIFTLENHLLNKPPSKALKWRQVLPKKLQHLSVEDIFKHLSEIGYTYQSVGYPETKEYKLF